MLHQVFNLRCPLPTFCWLQENGPGGGMSAQELWPLAEAPPLPVLGAGSSSEGPLKAWTMGSPEKWSSMVNCTGQREKTMRVCSEVQMHAAGRRTVESELSSKPPDVVLNWWLLA